MFCDDQVGAVFCGLYRGDPGTGSGGDRGQQRGFAARAGAKVQPSPVSSASGARVSARATNWLPSSCTSAWPSRTAGNWPGSPDGRYTAYGEYRPTSPLTAPANSSAVSAPGRAAKCTCGRSSSAANAASNSPAEAPNASTNDCAIQRGWARTKAACPTGSTDWSRCQFVDPGLLVAGTDLAQYPVDETRTRRIEFDSSLLDGSRDGGMCVDAGAEQLVRSQPQQVEQYRVDRLRLSIGGRADDGVQQAADAAAAVGQLGGEGGIATTDPPLAQQNWQQQVGIRVALAHRPQYIERGAPRRIQRLASRRPRRSLRGASGRPVAARPVRWRGHDARADGFQAGSPGPVDGVHQLLARCLHLAEPYRVRGSADPYAAPVNVNVAGRQRLWQVLPVGVDVHRPEFDAQVTDQRPRPRVRCDGADAPLDHFCRKVPTDPSLFDGDLRRDADAVGRLRDRAVSVPSAMPSSVADSNAAPEIASRSSRSPAVSIGRTDSVTTP